MTLARCLLLLLFLYLSEALECASGYGRARKIPDSYVNDGFCDCPLNGADEPETEACSGAPVGGWAGVNGKQEVG